MLRNLISTVPLRVDFDCLHFYVDNCVENVDNVDNVDVDNEDNSLQSLTLNGYFAWFISFYKTYVFELSSGEI